MTTVLQIYDDDHIWYEGKQFISLKRVGEMIKEMKRVVEPTLQRVESVGEDGSALKHGHWIVYDEGEGYPNTCECSNCGTFYDEEDAYCYDYCPNCGADMREVEE